jgi:hypothetical protein
MILNQIWHGLLPYVSTFYLFTYTFSPTYLHAYVCFSPSYEPPIYLPTYLHIIHLPIHPFTYLILTMRFSHYVKPLRLAKI